MKVLELISVLDLTFGSSLTGATNKKSCQKKKKSHCIVKSDLLDR